MTGFASKSHDIQTLKVNLFEDSFSEFDKKEINYIPEEELETNKYARFEVYVPVDNQFDPLAFTEPNTEDAPTKTSNSLSNTTATCPTNSRMILDNITSLVPSRLWTSSTARSQPSHSAKPQDLQ